MAGPALRLDGVGKRYGTAAVLRDVALQVAEGECVALLGPNGSGKSTLLRIAASLARPNAGHVEVAGLDVRKEPEKARGRLSILTQEAPLYPELTPREHLRWWAKTQSVPGQVVDGHLAAAGLTGVGDKTVRHLSRGTRQRLAVAMALLPDRPLLLLDEPFSALDDAGRAWLESELAARHGRQAVLLALHDAVQARALADRTLRIHAGRLEAAW